MLGSANDAEALAAARHAHRIVKDAGFSWDTLLVDTTSPAAPSPYPVDAWTDLQSRDPILYTWVMASFESNPMAYKIWASMGQGMIISDKGLRLARLAMQLSRARGR